MKATAAAAATKILSNTMQMQPEPVPDRERIQHLMQVVGLLLLVRPVHKSGDTLSVRQQAAVSINVEPLVPSTNDTMAPKQLQTLSTTERQVVSSDSGVTRSN